MNSTASFAVITLGLLFVGCASRGSDGTPAHGGAAGFEGPQQLAGSPSPRVDPMHDASVSSAPVGVSSSGGGMAAAGASGVGAAFRGAAGSGGAGKAGSDSSPSRGGSPATGGAMNAGGAIGTAGIAGGAAGTAATGAKFHVFLLLGQSNMSGYPKAQDADKTKNPRITVLGYDNCAATGRQQDKWDVAVPPLHECWNGAIGPGDYFSKTLLDKLPASDTIGLVPCAISGERIETFMKSGGTKYNWIVGRAKLAQQAGGVVEGILFHQGESNTGDQTWPGKVSTLISDLRKDLGLADVPFLAGELAYDGSSKGHNALVNKLPMIVSNAYVVSASGLALDPADTTYHVHFGHAAQVTFGERYAVKMIEALHW